MKTNIVSLCCAVLIAGSSVPVSADTLENIKQMVADGQTNVSMRYRYERVDQEGMDNHANASTLKTRLSYESGRFNGFFANVEVDNVTAIGNENYDSTINGNTQYPVVADPTDTDLNQAFIGYQQDNLTFSIGRQRIVHDNQRFVGGVAWRQNEQTFDGYRVVYDNQQDWRVDYSFIHNVNRIFGPSGAKADLAGGLHLFSAAMHLNDEHAIKFHVYELDFDQALAQSSRTFGITYEGRADSINWHLAFARQTDTGDNPNDYSANYWNAEIVGKLAHMTLGVGVENLGSDNGVGFNTPLATLHKFQGFADKFLGTPATGVNDRYIKASTSLGKLGISAVWHDLSADVSGIDYGTELNLVGKYPLAQGAGLLVKYADYNADDHATDTRKLWLMLNVQY
ncbi:alginate export family protein [Aestuariibacter halophilus]|uniref:Alginate export family protein n=1 Tax=Fluctibacter halophilus TaxID=226011 RepID=A0ABS8G3E6_9ALTE|nr:alginate export family protein [Aestuariibacter halophilus]MCC2615055.1 alginate export family protein [Aestuariibacter halophilus]